MTQTPIRAPRTIRDLLKPEAPLRGSFALRAEELNSFSTSPGILQRISGLFWGVEEKSGECGDVDTRYWSSS